MRIFAILPILLFYACTPAVEPDVPISITVELQVLKDDVFQLFYTDNYTDSYDEKSSIKLNVKGAAGLQKFKFDLPEGYIPQRVRLDLGDNKAQGNILIKEIIFSYKKSSKKYVLNDIKQIFVYNEGIVAKDDGYIQLPTNTGYYDPYMISKNLTPVMKSILK